MWNYFIWSYFVSGWDIAFLITPILLISSVQSIITLPKTNITFLLPFHLIARTTAVAKLLLGVEIYIIEKLLNFLRFPSTFLFAGSELLNSLPKWVPVLCSSFSWLGVVFVAADDAFIFADLCYGCGTWVWDMF